MNSESPVAGDLILIFKSRRLKALSTTAQYLLRLKKTNISHIAIAMSSSMALHSTPGLGVHHISLDKLLSPDNCHGYRVLRHTTIGASNKHQQELRASLLYFLGQGYIKIDWLRRRDSSSVCSMLAAKAFRRVGHPLIQRKSALVLPIDIERLRHHKDWIEVTGEYTDHLLHALEHGANRETKNAIFKMRKHSEFSSNFIARAELTIRETSLMMEDTSSLLSKGSKFLGSALPELPIPTKQWDSK